MLVLCCVVLCCVVVVLLCCCVVVVVCCVVVYLRGSSHRSRHVDTEYEQRLAGATFGAVGVRRR